jgi:hypothetical protein
MATRRGTRPRVGITAIVTVRATSVAVDQVLPGMLQSHVP